MPKAVQLVFIMKHGTSLNRRSPWDPINFIMVKHSLHIRFQCCDDVFVLGSPKQLSVSVLQIVVWNYVEKYSDLYLPFFSVAVLFEPSALSEIWSAEEMWSFGHCASHLTNSSLTHDYHVITLVKLTQSITKQRQKWPHGRCTHENDVFENMR